MAGKERSREEKGKKSLRNVPGNKRLSIEKGKKAWGMCWERKG
jgi:hypothetical protein